MDIIKVERAIAGLTEWQKHVQTESNIDRDISTAIEALKAQLSQEEMSCSEFPNSSTLQPTCNQLATDSISRQAAIDALDCISGVEEVLRALPSAQPEIIRCKDCEYGGQDEIGRWFCRSLGYQIGGDDGSGFCADAERRTDEQG